jgi:hypothetical protein
MPRLMITVSKKTDEALKRRSAETNAPVAALIREAIEEWAQRRGIDLESDVVWGGVRAKKEDESQGQFEAVA